MTLVKEVAEETAGLPIVERGAEDEKTGEGEVRSLLPLSGDLDAGTSKEIE